MDSNRTGFNSDSDLLRWVVDHYHQTLKQNQAVQAFLDKRGITQMQ